MRFQAISILCCSLFALACIHAEPASSINHVTGIFRFFVADGSDDGGMLENVDVILVGHEGSLVTLGRTDVFGSLAVPKTTITKGKVVIFIREGFFDGAWRVDTEKVARADEYYIRLARFAVR